MYQPTTPTEKTFFPSFLDEGKGRARVKQKVTSISAATATASTSVSTSVTVTKSRGLTATNPIIIGDDEYDDIIPIPGPTNFKSKDVEKARDNYEHKRRPRSRPYPTPDSISRSPPYKPDVSLGVSSLEFIRSSQSSSSDQKPHISHKRDCPSLPVSASSSSYPRKIISGSSQPSASRSRVHSLITQRAYGIKNTGLQATRDIPLGCLIIKEAPFLIVPAVDELTVDDLYQVIKPLSNYSKSVFNSFSSRTDENADLDTHVNIVETNGIPLGRDGDNDKVEELGLFENICRINHSCTPNSGWRWDSRKGQMHLYAYTNIRAGTEITASYLDDEELIASFNERNDRLLQGFGFTCACTACTTCRNDLEARARSDRRLERFREVQAEWESDEDEPLAFAIDYDEALESIKEAMSILKTEGKTHALGTVLERKFTVYSAYGMTERAKSSASEVVQHYSSILGTEKANELDFADWAIDPSRHGLWGDLASRMKKKKSGSKTKAGKKRRASDVSIWGDDHAYIDL